MSERPAAEARANKPLNGDEGITRRTFTIGALGSLAMVGLGGFTLLGSTPLLRPPGAQDEESFLRACIHCERCREVCPKHAIKPARIEDGLVSLRTPTMDFRSGWCDFCEETEYGLPLCVASCPTHAFEGLTGKPSEYVVIGKAVINPDWCLAYNATGCHECVDACPYDAMDINESGIPYVIADACNGCGACEHDCISLSAGSIASGATDRAITVVPLEVYEKL